MNQKSQSIENRRYKICWRVPDLQSTNECWTEIGAKSYASTDDAYEAMQKTGDRLCKDLQSICITKLDIYQYKLRTPDMQCCSPVVAQAVIVKENKFTLAASPVGWIQVFEV